jgi:hypothetical protein
VQGYDHPVIFRGGVAPGFAVLTASWLVVTGCSSAGSTSATHRSSSAGPRAVLELRPVLLAFDADSSGRTPDVAVPTGTQPSSRPTDASDPAWITPVLLAELTRLNCTGSGAGVAPGPASAAGDPTGWCSWHHGYFDRQHAEDQAARLGG